MEDLTTDKPEYKTIDQIERDITRNEPLLVRVFLSRKSGWIATIVGIALMLPRLFQLYVFDDQSAYATSYFSMIGLVGVMLLSYGLINLNNGDRNWGKPRAVDS
jgi:hypothetical protein